METTVVAAFVMAAVVLICGGVALIFFGVPMHGNDAFPFFLKTTADNHVLAACLVLIALALPVIDPGNPQHFPWLYLFSAIALLAASRVLLGRRAHWATWVAASLLAVLFAAPMMLPQSSLASEAVGHNDTSNIQAVPARLNP